MELICGLPQLFSEDITKRVCVGVVVGKADSACNVDSVFSLLRSFCFCVATSASLQKNSQLYFFSYNFKS